VVNLRLGGSRVTIEHKTLAINLVAMEGSSNPKPKPQPFKLAVAVGVQYFDSELYRLQSRGIY
jgi:hypothetical protein